MNFGFAWSKGGAQTSNETGQHGLQGAQGLGAFGAEEDLSCTLIKIVIDAMQQLESC